MLKRRSDECLFPNIPPSDERAFARSRPLCATQDDTHRWVEGISRSRRWHQGSQNLRKVLRLPEADPARVTWASRHIDSTPRLLCVGISPRIVSQMPFRLSRHRSDEEPRLFCRQPSKNPLQESSSAALLSVAHFPAAAPAPAPWFASAAHAAAAPAKSTATGEIYPVRGTTRSHSS